MKNEKPLSFPPFVLWILLFLWYGLLISLLSYSAPQIAHFIMMVNDMEELSKAEQYSHALKYAIALEVIIFLVTATGRTGAARWFIFISISTQLLSMHKWDEILMRSVWEDPQQLSNGLRLFTGMLIIGVMSGIGIHYISKQIKSTIEALLSKPHLKMEEAELKITQAEQRSAEAEQRSQELQVNSTLYQKQLKAAELSTKELKALLEESEKRRNEIENKLSRKKKNVLEVTNG